VSGAAEISRCCDNIILLSKEVGKEIARAHCVLISGATTGVPYFSAQGCKQAGGFNVGFSPASSEIEHLRRYRLPLDVFDVMIYTGADYSGRDIIMTKIRGRDHHCLRLHEFTTAVECGKIIGVLEGSGGTADKIRELVRGTYRGIKKYVYDRDPAALVRKVAERVDAEKKKIKL
jgi:hypothetical protein